MSWAARRRFIILLLLGAVGIAIAAGVIISALHKTPSCADSVQNQGEEGVDCGGPCPYLCTASEQPPTVLYTQPLPNGTGRTDIIASVENKNTDAGARAVPYRITLYGSDQVLIQEVTGTLDLPPAASVPVFVPGVVSGKQTVASAFLTIDPAAVQWFTLAKDPRLLPAVSGTTLGGATTSPVITATLSDPSATPLTNVKTVVIVHDGNGNAIAASQTIVSSIPGQGQAQATFTWNAPFPGIPVSIEVVPVIPLPAEPGSP